LPEAKKGTPPIIERTCVFDAKIYKNVDSFFDVSACGGGNKKKLQNSVFCFQLPSLLVEKNPKNSQLSFSLTADYADYADLPHEITALSPKEQAISRGERMIGP